MSATNGHNPERVEGAYGGEMDLDLDPRLRAFAGEARVALVRAPDRAVAEAHIGAIMAAVHAPAAASAGAPRRPRSRLPVLRLAAIGVGAVFVVSGGLAVAGVRPPEPVSDVFEAVGIDVPGSDSNEGSEQQPQQPAAGDRDNTASGEASRASGAGSSSDNPGTAAGQHRRHGDHGNGHGNAHSNGNGNGPAPASAEGQQTAAQAQSGQTPPTSPGQSESHPSPQGQAGRGSPPSNSQGTPPVDPQSNAPGQIRGGGNPHGTPPGAVTSAEAQALDPSDRGQRKGLAE